MNRRQAIAAGLASLAAGLWGRLEKVAVPRRWRITRCVVMVRRPQTCTWTGAAGDLDWANPANWDTGLVPGHGDTVKIPLPVVPVHLHALEVR